MRTLMTIGMLTLLANGCAYVQADYNVTKQIANDPDLTFAGAGVAAGAMLKDTRTIDGSLGDADILHLVTNAAITGIKIVPRGAVTSLDFVKSIVVNIEADSKLPTQKLADYTKGTTAMGPGGSIELNINKAFDHTPYVRDMSPLLLDFTVELAAPADEWGANLEMGFNMALDRQVSF
jgi:hypothetical protein